MEDVGRVPAADVSPVQANLEPTTIPTLDGWIESLMNCKQLAESDVQRLCDKVRPCLLPIHRAADCRSPFERHFCCIQRLTLPPLWNLPHWD